MKRRIYIVSHSSMDLASTLALYERYRTEGDVVIVVSGTKENLEFLRSVNVPEAVLRFLDLTSRQNQHRRRLVGYVGQLVDEKRALDELIVEIRTNKENQLVFHSYCNDPHAGYLVSRVGATNRVTLIDVLGVRPEPLRIADLLTRTGMKSLIHLAIVNSVFGRLFMLSGVRSYPMISLNLKTVNLATETMAVRRVTDGVAKYGYHLPQNGRNAIFLYADRFGIDAERHASINRMAIECLVKTGLSVFVKTHPQSQPPGFLESYDVRQIPKHIPFEFVDLTNVALVVGIAGASLLCTGAVPTVSILKLMYDERADHYTMAMRQLSQNRAIVFVSSMDELSSVAGQVN
jgi:hypothetical protein